MSWEVGGPTGKSGPAYRTSRRRQFLKYVGAASLGFGGGAVLTDRSSTEGVVTAIEEKTMRSDATGNASNNTTTSAGIDGTPITGTEPAIDEVLTVQPVSGQRKYVLVTLAVSNPLEEHVRKGLYVTIRHEPYESTGNRIAELPAESRHEYMVRVPRSGQIRPAILSAVENGDHEVEVSLGSLPERYGDG
jgi:hypothetical protein